MDVLLVFRFSLNMLYIYDFDESGNEKLRKSARNSLNSQDIEVQHEYNSQLFEDVSN